MKNFFTDPELKIIQFEAKDVLTASLPIPGDDELPIETEGED